MEISNFLLIISVHVIYTKSWLNRTCEISREGERIKVGRALTLNGTGYKVTNSTK